MSKKKNSKKSVKSTPIIENALLTRLYLENQEAFDVLDMRIEERGGHIKC